MIAYIAYDSSPVLFLNLRPLFSSSARRLNSCL
jgi:hypothetical protein